MIAEFPESTPITFDIQTEFNSITKNYPNYSEFNFINLMSWNRNNLGGLAKLNGNLVLYYPDYIEDSCFISFIGQTKLLETIRTLLDYAGQKLSKRKLELVPEEGVKDLKPSNCFNITEEPFGNDYIISLKSLIDMQCPELRRFRRAVRCFNQQSGKLAVPKLLDISSRRTQKTMLEVFECRESQKLNNDSANELEAINQLFKDQNHYNLIGYGVEIEGRLRAFIICENVGGSWSVGHFWKADITYPGIYSYLMLQTANYLVNSGIGVMNIMQDLGIDNLRFFKSSFNPIFNLKKYTISD